VTLSPALFSVFFQTLPSGTNGSGNESNTSTAVSQLADPELGPVGELLQGIGVPYARTLGALITLIVVFAVLYGLARATVIPLVNRLLDARGFDRHTRRPILRLTKALVAVVIASIAFQSAGYTGVFSALATIGAAATLAIGFALQDVIGNFVAGVFIYTDRPFRIGDWIEWDEYGGVVEDISLRVTRVRTFDNERLTVPNSVLTSGVIKNPVAYETLRLSVGFGIGYEDDIDRASEILLEEATTHDRILEEPEPRIHMSEEALADSYIGLTARIWIAEPSRADFLAIRSEYIKAVKKRFDAEGIDIPYPQVDLSGGIELANPQSMPGRADD
jgi:small conductance mechanosensitive channel